MQNSLAGSPVSKKAKYHIIGAAILLSKCQSRSCSNLCTHNSMTSPKTHVLSKKVHASTLPLCTTGCLTIQFGHTAIHINTFCNSQSMITISGNKSIFRTRGSHTSCGNCFLPDIGMKESADLPFHFVFLFCHQFKLTDKLHQLIPVEICFFRKFCSHRLQGW